MNFKNGGKAQLKTGEDGKYIMPFVGELKNLMLEMEDELSKCKIIKEKLENFIKEKEITSEYSLAEIDFLDKNGIERKNNRVKFNFNYMNSGFCLISYYYNGLLLGMERMNNVTNFIKENIMYFCFKKSPDENLSGDQLLNYSAELSVDVAEASEEVASLVAEEVALVSDVVLLVSDVVEDVLLLVVDVVLLVVEEDVPPRFAKFPLYITMKLTIRATIKKVKAAVFVSLLSLASLDLPAFF